MEHLFRMSIRDETLTLGMTNKTFDTFASDWTQCTNIAFDKLLKKFQLKNAHHKVCCVCVCFYPSGPVID